MRSVLTGLVAVKVIASGIFAKEAAAPPDVHISAGIFLSILPYGYLKSFFTMLLAGNAGTVLLFPFADEKSGASPAYGGFRRAKGKTSGLAQRVYKDWYKKTGGRASECFLCLCFLP
jgi:hypothetical protein